ncbi:hypothetical protein OYC64_006931 [Pagothenia borchgrevinki]|uniref:Uncharacterized protein n=1 Tax=Pagothenia borchgrevinki TaxID=8213 RepID=A0ABD2G3U3_PAGBO
MIETPNTPVFICSCPVTRQRGRGSLPSLLPAGSRWAATLRRHGHHLGGSTDLGGGLPWTPDPEVPDKEKSSSSSSPANGAIHPAGIANVNGTASAISWSPKHLKQRWWGSAPAIKPGPEGQARVSRSGDSMKV